MYYLHTNVNSVCYWLAVCSVICTVLPSMNQGWVNTMATGVRGLSTMKRTLTAIKHCFPVTLTYK